MLTTLDLIQQLPKETALDILIEKGTLIDAYSSVDGSGNIGMCYELEYDTLVVTIYVNEKTNQGKVTCNEIEPKDFLPN